MFARTVAAAGCHATFCAGDGSPDTVIKCCVCGRAPRSVSRVFKGGVFAGGMPQGGVVEQYWINNAHPNEITLQYKTGTDVLNLMGNKPRPTSEGVTFDPIMAESKLEGHHAERLVHGWCATNPHPHAYACESCLRGAHQCP
eukprot:3937339-Rhodomonas_salina.1